MAKVGFAVPILPGKVELATKHSIAEIRRRMPEHDESRRRAGVTMERVYLQQNPDGSNLFTGIDFRRPAPGGGPGYLAGWEDPAGGRGMRLAFTVPLLPGKAGALGAWAREAVESRRQELTESWLAFGQTREEVFPSSSPAGDVGVANLKGKDPGKANREFAASDAARRFRTRLAAKPVAAGGTR